MTNRRGAHSPYLWPKHRSFFRYPCYNLASNVNQKGEERDTTYRSNPVATTIDKVTPHQGEPGTRKDHDGMRGCWSWKLNLFGEGGSDHGKFCNLIGSCSSVRCQRERKNVSLTFFTCCFMREGHSSIVKDLYQVPCCFESITTWAFVRKGKLASSTYDLMQKRRRILIIFAPMGSHVLTTLL